MSSQECRKSSIFLQLKIVNSFLDDLYMTWNWVMNNKEILLIFAFCEQISGQQYNWEKSV